ncbi:MAG: hypothetical protein R6U70_05480 [Bacillota bacterium]
MLRSRDARLGFLLIVAGITLLLTMLGLLPGAIFLMIFGLSFCGVYGILGGRNSYGNIGFLIPGLVLLSVASYALLNDVILPQELDPGFFFLLLSGAFLAVFLIHTRVFRTADHGSRYWPLYPCIGLSLLGAAVLTKDYVSFSWAFLQLINYLWVAALLAAGLWLVFRSRSNRA